MIKIWQETLPYIKQKNDWFEVLNFRNFDRKMEDQNQIKNYEIANIKYREITNIWLYVIPFTFGGKIAHSIIWIETSDGKEFCVSREAQFEQWEEWTFWNSIRKWYRAIVLRWSAEDMIWLRDNIRKWEKVYGYKLKINDDYKISLVKKLISLTNQTNSNYESYNIVSKNCASGIWKYIYNDFWLPKWSWRLLFTSYLPNLLIKKWYIDWSKYIVKAERAEKAKKAKIIKTTEI